MNPNQPILTVTEFKNELGNVIRITIEGPTSKSTNDLTPLETAELNKALTKHFAPPLPDGEAVAWRVKNDAGYWYVTPDMALAKTWRDIEKLHVEPLYVRSQHDGS